MSNLRVEGQQEFTWATTMTTVSAAITGLVQFGSIIVAAYYLEHAIATRGKGLESILINEEVKEADDKVEELNKAYEEVTLRFCYGSVMVQLWFSYSSVVVMSWLCYGNIMVTSWFFYGSVMVLLWLCHGYVMVLLWLYYGYVMVI